MIKHANHKENNPVSLPSGIGKALKKMGKTGVAATKGSLDAFVVPMTRYVAPPPLPPEPQKPKPKAAVAAASKILTSRGSNTAQIMPRSSRPQKSKPAAVAAAVTTEASAPTAPTTGTEALSTGWLVERLHGGHGRADAQASWDARRTEKLTATDVALFNKRRILGQQAKARQPGWRVQGDKRVFVAYTGAGMQVAEGSEAFRLNMAFGKGKTKREGGGGGEARKTNGSKSKKRGRSDKDN